MHRTLSRRAITGSAVETVPSDEMRSARATDAAAMARNDPDELRRLAIGIALHGDDPDWAQQVCVQLSSHANANVRGNAILGFGHLARRFGALDMAAIGPLVIAALSDSERYVREQADVAADDLEQFIGWTRRTAD